MIDTTNGVLHIFNMYKSQMGYGILAAVINALGHYKCKHTFRSSFVDVLFCGALGWGVDGFLRATGMAPEGAVMVASMIGYIGANGVSEFLKNRIGIQTVVGSNEDVNK